MTNLPTNIDDTYPDRSEGDRLHQQHHDTVHGVVNKATSDADDGLLARDGAGGIETVGRDTYAEADTAGDVAEPIRETIFLPADDRWATAAGTPAFTTRPSSPSTYQRPAILFDPSSVEQITATLVLPSHWATFDVEVAAFNTGTAADDVVWIAYSDEVGDGDDPATLNVGSATVTMPTTANRQKNSTVASGVAVGVAGDVRMVTIRRFASDADDTLAVDAGLYGVYLRKAS